MTGKKKTQSAKTSNHREAEREASKLEDKLRAGSYRGKCRLTWTEFWDRYEDEHLARLAPKTGKKSRTIRSVLMEILAPQRITDLTAARLSHFQSQLRKRGCTEQTIGGYVSHIRSALSWAFKMDLIPAVPKIESVGRPKGQRSKGRSITGEEFDRLLAMVEKVVGPEAAPSFTEYLYGLWWSGLRLGESLELYWDRDDRLCVDLTGKRPMLRIPAQLEKGNQDRVLPMAPEFAAFLAKTPVEERTGRVFKLARRCHEGERLTDDRVGRLVSKIGEKAMVKVWTHPVSGKVKFASAHDLRRSFGFRWSSRVMPAVLQQMMRHENIETTMEFYVGRDAEATADAMWQAFDNLPGNKSGNSDAKTVNFSAER
ncbi:MAG: hypothetical protein EXS05_23365 [Planctomycetaceae bacterium]|nr:hypothetical protein [Planctomycetaceae bacterium]